MGPDHKKLFQAYVSELNRARQVASVNSSHRNDPRFVPAPSAAERTRRPAPPPAAHPQVLGTITKYFFACKRLNEELESQGLDYFVYPQVFVHEMLTGQQQELWEFLADLPYLPVGLKPDDSWV
jgi:hypothetical protein